VQSRQFCVGALLNERFSRSSNYLQRKGSIVACLSRGVSADTFAMKSATRTSLLTKKITNTKDLSKIQCQQDSFLSSQTTPSLRLVDRLPVDHNNAFVDLWSSCARVSSQKLPSHCCPSFCRCHWLLGFLNFCAAYLSEHQV
jgi:hypothetical protein